MHIAGTILTGLNTYRNRSHAPVILDYSVANEWFARPDKSLNHANYEHFEVRPVTRALLYRLLDISVGQHTAGP